MRAETFDFPDVVGKWIEGKGLPYAIVEDLPPIPREPRVDMRSLATFGPTAVVENTRPANARRGLTPNPPLPWQVEQSCLSAMVITDRGLTPVRAWTGSQTTPASA